MREKIENDIYHDICTISKKCRDFFYGRKYLPRDFWSFEGNVEDIIKKAEELKKTYQCYKNAIKEENNE